MLKNYFIISLRKLVKQKFHSILNLMGLSIGIASVILMLLFVIDELSFDKFNEQSNHIYRVVENQYYGDKPAFPVAVTPPPLGPSLQSQFPAIELACRLYFTNLKFTKDDLSSQEMGAYVDPAFLDIFSVHAVDGKLSSSLDELDNIVITESLAKKYFGTLNPINQLINIGPDQPLRVAAVIQDFPRQSHIQPAFLVPMNAVIANQPSLNTAWGKNALYTYVLVNADADLNQLNGLIKDHIKENKEGSVSDIYLQPLEDIHLSTTHFAADISKRGNIEYVTVSLISALIILFLACINYMNLTTARSITRAKEVGLRKTLGAQRLQLAFQFLSESMVSVFLSSLLAIIFVYLLLPEFNLIAGKDLSIKLLLSSKYTYYIVSVVLITGILSGSYPAIYLSSFRPISVTKKQSSTTLGGLSLRKSLVVLQFCISLIIITGTLAISKQIQFIRSKNLGYSKEQVIKIPKISRDYQSFKNSLLSQSEITGITASNQHPAYVENSTSGLDWSGKNENEATLIHLLAVDFDYLKTMQINLAAGRDFIEGNAADSFAIIINKEAQRTMKFTEPIGQKIEAGDRMPYTVIGVVDDFHFKSIHQKIEPLVIYIARGLGDLRYTLVRIEEGDPKSKLEDLKQTWKNFNPDEAFVYSFLDEDFDTLYKSEEQTGVIFKYFSGLAIFISCLGLFGLSSYSLEQRTKEFGIRKVFGASFTNLFFKASFGFMVLVLFAFVLSIPISLYFINEWMEEFAYHVGINYMMFVLTGLMGIGIALITVGFQCIKSALVNPVDSLRYE